MLSYQSIQLALLAVAFLSYVPSYGQTTIWGVGSATGTADAEFQSAFTQSTTVGSYAASQWTALSISESGGATTPGNAYWIRTTTGVSQGAYATGMTPIASSSQSNGAAIFDSDFMDNAGTAGAAGTGTSPSPHRGELISPRIDLTGYKDSALVVQFYSAYRPFNITELSVSMSIDDGVTWTTVDWRNLQPVANNSSTEGWVNVPFYTLTAGALSLTDCRIKFSFEGDYYYSIIDDISIKTAPEYDIAIGLPDPAATNLAGAFRDVKVGNNRYIPWLNVDMNQIREWFYGLKAVNYGFAPIVPSMNPQVHIQISHDDGLGIVTPNVYVDTIAITDTIPSGGLDGPVAVEDLRDINFINTFGVGTYTVKYWVAHSGTDASTENDTTYHAFTLTPVIESYLSKCRLSPSDGKVLATRPIFPGGTSFSNFEYGSMYYFPKGDDIKIDSIEFRYYVPNGYTGSSTQTLAVKIYEVTDFSTGTLDQNGTGLVQEGVGVVTLTGIGTTVANGSYGLASVTNIQNASSGGPLGYLKDNGVYLISLQENPGLFGGSSFNANSGVWFGADEYNYAINAASTDTGSLFIPNPSPVLVQDAAGTGDWNWVGFGADMVPSLGIYLNPGPLNNKMVKAETSIEVAVFPNPTSDRVNISAELDETSDALIILTDVSGRVLLLKQKAATNNIQESLDLTAFPTGTYFLTVKTAQEDVSRKIVKQ